MNTSGRVIPVNGIAVDLIGNDKAELASTLRTLADKLDVQTIPLVHGMLSTLAVDGRTVGQWRVV